jgi:hypothetical protein
MKAAFNFRKHFPTDRLENEKSEFIGQRRPIVDVKETNCQNESKNIFPKVMYSKISKEVKLENYDVKNNIQLKENN